MLVVSSAVVVLLKKSREISKGASSGARQVSGRAAAAAQPSVPDGFKATPDGTRFQGQDSTSEMTRQLDRKYIPKCGLNQHLDSVPGGDILGQKLPYRGTGQIQALGNTV